MSEDRSPLRPAGGPAPDVDPTDLVVRLLARYSQTRLAPRDDQLTRLRAVLVASYVRARGGVTEQPAPQRRLGRGWHWALAGALVLALTGGASLVAAESGPAQPFYHLRLAVENLTLPAARSARVEALLSHLNERLAEAEQASRRGDTAAAADALSAYEATLSQLSDAVAAGGADTTVLAELDRHVATLQNLLGVVPAQAKPGLQNALDHAQRAREAIGQRPIPGDHPAPGGARPSMAAPSARP